MHNDALQRIKEPALTDRKRRLLTFRVDSSTAADAPLADIELSKKQSFNVREPAV